MNTHLLEHLRLLLSPGAPRGLWDRPLGTPVRLVGARNPVLDRLRIPAPASGPEPGQQAQGVTHFPSARRAMIGALSDHPAASLESLAEAPIVSGTARRPDRCTVPVPSLASPR